MPRSGTLAVEVRHRGRAPLQRPPPARRRAGRGGHAGSLRRVPVLAGGRRRAASTSAAATATSMRWRPTAARCAGKFQHRQRGARLAGARRRRRVRGQLGQLLLRARRRRAARSAGASRPARIPAINNQVGIQSSAVVADGIVYFGCRDSQPVCAGCARAARERWAFPTRAPGWSAPRRARRRSSTSRPPIPPWCTPWTRRAARRCSRSASTHWPFFSSPALAGNYLYIGSHAGKLIAIDLKDAQGGLDLAHRRRARRTPRP